ncbi:right-handed parallel beta-helix repeat-containing protein [Frateuria sp. MAH-13]|uniref:Right-handed parallel beta-helix repeat-containing protein n=1 Tax=Frateuria flava TaxID=2821489 RepID=A0ABS4DL94_9GAMM|nr:right-handed parallel beta-helix repeat-containing protein [Frateuria flava]MBP1473819.1 right-handed parallel beta-helix repeat-containing protein [Frateuria flava]
MTNQHDTQSSAKPGTTKRDFSMKKSLMIAVASLSLSAVALPAAASNWWNANPNISIGSASVNVKNKGALGNGSHDDTAAIQAAINSLPSSGGTVVVPAGRYMINALKPLNLRSHTRLQLDPSAELKVIPNSAGRYWVVKVFEVNNVEIVGGKVTGDRAQHKGNTGEWGYGINISGSSNVLVRNVNLSEFWGDGMWIGAVKSGGKLTRSNYVTVNNVTSSHNRRQGLSIGPAQHVYIVNSTFKDTQGTLPEAGIDIEPQDQGPADTIRLENNTFSGNAGNGIELHYNISQITITGNTLSGNDGFGMLAISAPYLTITNNYATRNGLAGVGLSGKTHHSSVKSNKLQYNSTHYMSPTRSGGADNRDIKIGKKTSSITLSGNQLTPN